MTNTAVCVEFLCFVAVIGGAYLDETDVDVIAFALLLRALIAERVRAGMARAKRQGKHVGRPQC